MNDLQSVDRIWPCSGLHGRHLDICQRPATWIITPASARNLMAYNLYLKPEKCTFRQLALIPWTFISKDDIMALSSWSLPNGNPGAAP